MILINLVQSFQDRQGTVRFPSYCVTSDLQRVVYHKAYFYYNNGRYGRDSMPIQVF